MIIIIGILTAIGVRSMNNSLENRKFLGTKQEMEVIRTAIVGDPDLKEGGVRTYFGYVGDVGALPANLDALRSNPGVAGWDGPYLEFDFQEDLDAFKRDAWGELYSDHASTDLAGSSGDPMIGSPGGSFTLKIGDKDGILNNVIEIRIFDKNGVVLTPTEIPASNVSITVASTTYQSEWWAAEQVYKFSDNHGSTENGIPIGNREIDIDASSLGVQRTVPVSINLGDSTRKQITLDPNYGTLQLTGDAPAETSPGSGVIEMTLLNGGTPPYNITRVNVDWESGGNGNCWNGRTPYLGYLDDNTTPEYWDYSESGSARRGAGSDISLDNMLTVAGTESITLYLRYSADQTNAVAINMTGTVFTLEFDPTKGPTQTVTFELNRNCSEPSLSASGTWAVNAGNSNYVDVTVNNSGSLGARVNAMTVEWGGVTGALVTGIVSGATTWWSGTGRANGDKIYLNDIYTLANGNTNLQYQFDNDMSAISSLEVKYHFADGSQQTVVF